MIYYLISVLEAFLPAALLLGLGWSAWRPPAPRRLAAVLVAAVLAGAAAGRLLPVGPVFALRAALVQIALVGMFFMLLRAASPRVGYGASGLLALAAAFRWGRDPNLGALTATAVVNTELLLNLAAMAAAFAGLALLAAQMARLGRLLPGWRRLLLPVLAALLLLPLAGHLLLALMKTKACELTAGRLSFVATVTNFSWVFTYAALACVLLLAVAAFGQVLLAQRKAVRTAGESVSRRKAVAAYRGTRRLLAGAAALVLLLAGAQWYWDHVASQPLQLSRTTRVTLAADGQIHLPLEEVADGRLHRFDWVAGDGKIVRFFVINRFAGRISPTVVFDACALCGDKGYVKQGDRVVCVACGVQLFIPSVGKAGGCNPIPMEGWAVRGGEVLVGRESLAAGRSYFTAVLDRKTQESGGRQP